MLIRRLPLAVALVACVTAPLAAQRLGPAAKRPRLDASADTNNSVAYYQLGLSLFESDPEEAAAAFYWAARLDPSSGDALYGRRVALLAADERLLKLVMQGNRRTLESDEVRRLDSLQFRALMLNPFMRQPLDRPLFMRYFRNAVTGGNRSAQTAALDFEIDRYLRTAGPAMRAWLYAGDGAYALALDTYRLAIGDSHEKTDLRLERARIFGLLHQVDNAVSEFQIAIEELRKKDKKDLVTFYNSKAMAEYSTAVLLEEGGKIDAAKEAYGRALQEDLAYWPARMRLGLLALGLKDTTAALGELSLAAQAAPAEPQVRYINGYVLASADHWAEAAKEFAKAVELEPYFALPYLRLGQAHERASKAKEAADAYSKFLAYSNATDPQRDYAKEHLDTVKEYLDATVKSQKP